MDANVARKLAAQAAERERARQERLRAEIEALFARRAVARYLWTERWGHDGSAYAAAR